MRLAAAGAFADPFTGDWDPKLGLSSAETRPRAKLFVLPGESHEAKSVQTAIVTLGKQLEVPVAFAEIAGREFPLLLCRVDAEPVEDGMKHPAQSYIEDFVARHGADELPTLLSLTDN